MPVAPGVPMDQTAQTGAGAGLNPANFLIAAAEMHGAGQLSSPVPAGQPLQTGKTAGKRKHMQVVK